MYMMKFLTVVLLFFIIANPALFKAMRGVLGGWVASAEGLPKTGGLLLHAVVFALVTRFIMKRLFRRRYSQYAEDYAEEYGAEDFAEDFAEEYEDEKYAEE